MNSRQVLTYNNWIRLTRGETDYLRRLRAWVSSLDGQELNDVLQLQSDLLAIRSQANSAGDTEIKKLKREVQSLQNKITRMKDGRNAKR